METALLLPIDPNDVEKVRDVIGEFALEVITSLEVYEDRWDKLTE